MEKVQALLAAVFILFAIGRPGQLALGAAASTSDEPLSFTKLEELIQSQKVRSLEELLPLLPDQYRSKFSLIYRSESAQGASAKSPRVILYGDSGGASRERAKLILAFTGDPKSPGGQVFEAIEYKPDTKKFEFSSVDFSGKKPRIERSPESCVKCHSGSLHPNWDTYPLWPGALGGNHGGHIAGGPLRPKRVFFPEIEVEAAENFFSKAKEHPRYKNLRVDELGPHATTSMKLAWLDRNNADLSKTLTNYNSERILNEITSAPAFPKFQGAFESWVQDRGDFLSHFPEAAQDPAAAEKRLQAFREDTKQRLKLYFEERQERYLRSSGRAPQADEARFELEKAEVDSVARLRYLAEDHLKIPTRDWALTRYPDTYAFIGPEQGIQTVADLWRAKNAVPCAQGFRGVQKH